jgi:predicted Zn-dependent protease
LPAFDYYDPMSAPSAPVGTLQVALAHAQDLLATDPDLAAKQAGEILQAVPEHPLALLILAAAHRRAGRTDAALALLETLKVAQPKAVPVYLELGVAQAQAGDAVAAVGTFQTVVGLRPQSVDGWRLLAEQFDVLGDVDQADAARARYLACAARDPRLMEAGAALVANDLPRADARLRSHLKSHPNDVAALRMLAEVAARLRLYQEAERLLNRCLDLAPTFDGARQNLAMVLNREGKASSALVHVDQLLAKEPNNPTYLNLKAAVLANMADYHGSIAVYEKILNAYPQQPRIWLSYGHSLRTAGRTADSISAYRRALTQLPSFGEAYWSLANLKTFRFGDAEVLEMQALTSRSELGTEDRLHIEFSLGKAFEDQRAYAESFAHYRAGNALRKKLHPYDARQTTEYRRRHSTFFTKDLVRTRQGSGAAAADPIFIVGLPRAGSTLIDQILSSHSQVEGTIELPDLPHMVRELAGPGYADRDDGLFEALRKLSPTELRELGERYLRTTAVHRKLGRPFFIDKMPNNFLYVGLIQLILPNAKIIDARRHPLACCFSAFKQHFARGQNFSYALEDLGLYYRDYVAQMKHVDTVLPGRVHRVVYESMIENTETEILNLLAYIGLPFEEGCLKFYENDRPVRTASSEQVKQPIYREGMEQWRHFEPWLDSLKATLGNVLDVYPAVPKESID